MEVHILVGNVIPDSTMLGIRLLISLLCGAVLCQSLIIPTLLRKFHADSTLKMQSPVVANVRPNFLSFTTEALEKMRKISSNNCFRIGIVDGGCSGMSYSVEPALITDKAPDDKMEVYNGICCLVDPFSLTYIEGINIGYRDSSDPDQSGFTFENPHASSSW